MNQSLLIFVVGAFAVAGAVLTNFYLSQDENLPPSIEQVQSPKDLAKKRNKNKKIYPKQKNNLETKSVNKVLESPDGLSRGLNKKIKPSFDVVRVTPEGNIVIAGRGEPKSTVAVMVDGRSINRSTQA